MAPPPPPPSPSASTATDSHASTTSSSVPPIPLSSIAAAASSSNMMNYLWIPLLIALSKELSGSANAQSTAVPLLMPSGHTGAFATVPRCPAADPNLNFRPVIGILSHPGDGASGRLNNASDASYIAASYVKFVESAGARVIPLIYNEPSEVLYEKLSLVNGVIFTGGWAKSGHYFEVVESIFKNVLRKNDAGDRFPLLAICLGFELLTMIVSEDKSILEEFSATDQASTLQFMSSINTNGTVFQRFPPALLKKLSTECLVMQNHRPIVQSPLVIQRLALVAEYLSRLYGISPEKFQKSKRLCNFFEILTTSADEDGKVYVSTIQAHGYPVTAVQWHPEICRLADSAFNWIQNCVLAGSS
ncbi:hypothetical protein DH2020_033772 [Rehmannia glutinosa]|uniref:folate gamma-glutamyl hydrolase n=1 Tax=Rehmannia glutinosa TaxID=99300 RepID=A0ABR0VC62_REHGL